MSGHVLAFPASAARPAPPLREPAFSRPFVPAAREYDLAAIAHLVGMAHCSRKVLIATLRKLADQSGMPLPKTPRIHAGQVCTGADAIGARSRWDAMRFDAWLDSHTPPPVLSASVAVLRHDAGPVVRSSMASRAAALGAMGRKRA